MALRRRQMTDKGEDGGEELFVKYLTETVKQSWLLFYSSFMKIWHEYRCTVDSKHVVIQEVCILNAITK